MYQIYQIKFNDTKENIASRFNITPEELEIINNNLVIEPGRYIVVPATTNNYQKYIVQNGDTIYKIASNFNIDPNTLILLNGLNKDDYIYPNEEILIPQEGYGVIITNDNTTLDTIRNYSDLEEIIRLNTNIYLLPGQTLLYRKEK